MIERFGVRRRRLFAVGAGVLMSVGLVPEAHAQIRATHPRIYLTPTNVLSMQARWAGQKDAELNEVVAYSDRRLANPSAVDAELAGNYPNGVVLPMALAAVVTGESRFVDASLRHLDLLVGIAAPTGGAIACSRWRSSTTGFTLT